MNTEWLGRGVQSRALVPAGGPVFTATYRNGYASSYFEESCLFWLFPLWFCICRLSMHNVMSYSLLPSHCKDDAFKIFVHRIILLTVFLLSIIMICIVIIIHRILHSYLDVFCTQRPKPPLAVYYHAVSLCRQQVLERGWSYYVLIVQWWCDPQSTKTSGILEEKHTLCALHFKGS